MSVLLFDVYLVYRVLQQLHELNVFVLHFHDVLARLKEILINKNLLFFWNKQTWYARWNLTKIEKKFEGLCVRGGSPWIWNKKFLENKVPMSLFLPKYSTHWLNESCATLASFTKRSILSGAMLRNSSNVRVSTF